MPRIALIPRLLILSFLCMPWSALAASPPARVFILGDDTAAGFAASPDFLLVPPSSPPPRPNPPVRRAPLARGDYTSALSWVMEHMRDIMAASVLEAPEHAWPYLAARAHSIPHEEILVGARSGEGSSLARRQFKRALAANEGLLPEMLIVQFGRSDVCLGPAAGITPDVYEAHLRDLLDDVDAVARRQRAKPPLVILAAPEPLSAILASPTILDHPTLIGKKTLSCRDYRRTALSLPKVAVPADLPFGVTMLLERLALYPIATCPAAFVDPDSEAGEFLVTRMANDLREYRDALERLAADKASTWKHLKLRYLSSTGERVPSATQISSDCIHLARTDTPVALPVAD